MHARITVQLLPYPPLNCGGRTITDVEIADAIREIFNEHGVTDLSIKALPIVPRLYETSK